MSPSEYPVSQTASTIKLYQNNANEIEILFTNYKHVPPTYSMNSCFVEWIEIGTLAVFVSTAYVSRHKKILNRSIFEFDSTNKMLMKKMMTDYAWASWNFLLVLLWMHITCCRYKTEIEFFYHSWSGKNSN